MISFFFVESTDLDCDIALAEFLDKFCALAGWGSGTGLSYFHSINENM